MNIQNLKKSKKGFTLVEIIVVLVIIAILAAIAIPAMTGWIDKAKDKANYAEARTCLLAAQTLASEAYASTPLTSVPSASISALAEVTGTPSDATLNASKTAVTSMSYTGTNLKTITYSSVNGWTTQ